AAFDSRVTPVAPASSGRSVPKWAPRSPTPAAEKSASQAAWAATSASEWPASPRSPGQVSPASDNVASSSLKGCTSTPIPIRGRGIEPVAGPARDCGLSGIRAILKESRRHGKVGRSGDLQRPMIAIDDAHVPADPLDEPGIIAGGGAAGVGMLEHLTQ